MVRPRVVELTRYVADLLAIRREITEMPELAAALEDATEELRKELVVQSARRRAA
jgi:hypothetical protein